MHEKNIKRLHTVCGIATAVLVLVAGICFIASCLSIYQSGEKPFSPASVAAHFRAIRIPVLTCIVSIAVSAIVSVVFPLDTCKTKAIRAHTDILASLKSKAGTITDEKLAANAMQEQNRQKNIRFFIGCILIGASVPHLFYFADDSHFTVESLNQNVMTCILLLSLSALIILAALIIGSQLTNRCLQRQITIYKAALAGGKCDGIPTAKEKKACQHTVLIARGALCAIAVVFILLGIFNGGIQDVLGKAIAICTECIGLG